MSLKNPHPRPARALSFLFPARVAAAYASTGFSPTSPGYRPSTGVSW